MGSDGLFNALNKETIIHKVGTGIRSGLSGEEICREVIKMAEMWGRKSFLRRREYDKSYMKKEDDDISVCIMFFNQ